MASRPPIPGRAAAESRRTRVLAAAVLVAACAAPAAAQQVFTGGPLIFTADPGHANTVLRQTLSITVATASAIRSISVPLGFRSGPEFEFLSQTGCAVDGATVNAAGTVCTVTVRFAPAGPGLRTGQLRVTAGDGTITNFGLSGTGFYPQAAVFPALTTVFAGMGSAPGSGGDGGPAISASFSNPGGIVADAFGNVYIAETANNAVRMIDAFGNITTIATENTQGFTAPGSGVLAQGVKHPTYLAIDSAQNLYIADSGEHVVRKMPLGTGGPMVTVAGQGLVSGFDGDGAQATAATLNNPQGLVLDPAGNLYVADSGNGRIRRIDSATGVITTVAGNGGTGVTGPSVPPDQATFNVPTALALDSAGNLYIADGNASVKELTGSNVVTVAGTGYSGSSGEGGAATSARIGVPTGLALDAADNLYIADSTNSVVHRVARDTGLITLYAGGGSAPSAGGALPSTQLTLAQPAGIAFDLAQKLYIVDAGNNVVRRIDPSAGELAFEATAAGSSSAPVAASLTNIGNAPMTLPAQPLSFSNAASTANYVLSGSNCGAPLAAGDQCTFNVTYAPQSAGANPGELDATDDSLTPGTVTSIQPLYLLGGVTTNVLTLTPSTLPAANVGSAYSTSLTAAGGYGSLTLDEDGALPAGITFSISGATITFSGTPTVTGDFPLTVFVSDTLGNTLAQSLTLSVTNPVLTLSVTEILHVSDAVNLLPSLSLAVAENIHVADTLLLLPTLTLSMPEVITVTDSVTLLPSLTLTVTEPIHVADAITTMLPLVLSPGSGALPAGTVNTAYPSTVFSASGGSGTYTFAASTGLPQGMTFAQSGSTYVLSGTPLHAGTYSFSVTANDGQATPVTQTYSLVVQPAQQTITTGALPTPVYGGAAFTVPVSASSGLPVTLTVVSGPVSATAPYAITGAGVVSFHAAQAGNSDYAAAALDFTVTVQRAPLTITAANASRAFAQPNPAFTYTISGFVNGEGVSAIAGSPILSTPAVGISIPGQYSINVAMGTLAAANYSFTLVPGILTVQMSAATQSILFNKLPSLHAGMSMLLAARSTSGLPVSYTVSGPATLSGATLTVTGSGTVTVTASQAGNAAYAAAPSVARSFVAP